MRRKWRWGITPEVHAIVERVFEDESPLPALRLSTEELEAANKRVARRLDMDPERVQLILSYGAQEE